MWLLTIALISFTILWRQVANERLRSILMPWAVAVLMMNVTSASFYWGWLHALLALTNYAAWIICLDGFAYGTRSNNRVWQVFILFWGYLMLSSFMGSHPFQGVATLLNAFISSFCVGYYIALWTCKTEGGLRRLNITVTCASVIIGYLYIKHGAFASMDKLQETRAVFDATTFEDKDMVVSVNYTALAMCSVLPFLLVASMAISRDRVQKIFKWVALGAMVLCLTVLIKTGARNGGLALLPLGWYLLFSTKNKLKKRSRRFLVIAVVILCAVFAMRIMRGTEGVRALRFFSTGGGERGVTLNEISSGRIQWWIDEYNSMTPVQVLLGRGFVKESLNERGRAELFNYHSIYVLVFLHSGLVGIFLMVIALGTFFVVACRKGDRGRMAIMFLSVWALTGVGEAAGVRGGVTAILAGFAMGLCSDNPVRNTELMNDKECKMLYALPWRGIA